MTLRPFLDTNILAYAYSDDPSRNERAAGILQGGGLISVQVLNEFTDLMRRKMGYSWGEVRSTLDDVRLWVGPAVPMTVEVHDGAIALSTRYGFRIYDSLILSAALRAGCRTLYTEDLQHGQVVDGLSIVNPFRPA